MQQRPHTLLAAFAPLLLALLAGLTEARGQTLQIDPSTASWIEGFADFVHWEDAENAEAITIAVIGAPEVAFYLSQRAETRQSEPRLEVEILTPEDSFEGVDIVFVGGSNREQWEEILSKCASNRTLSIGSQDGFLEAGGCVEFVVRRNQLRFQIADEHTGACQVTLSSKLLELAIEPNRR